MESLANYEGGMAAACGLMNDGVASVKCMLDVFEMMIVAQDEYVVKLEKILKLGRKFHQC